MGSNKCGKLGINDINIVETREPNLVVGIQGQIIQASCGENHTIAVSSNGDVYAFGEGLCCGVGSLGPIPNPVRIAHHDRFISSAAGCEHTLLLDNFGRVYGFGSNREGQIGTLHYKDELLPVQVPIEERIVEI